MLQKCLLWASVIGNGSLWREIVGCYLCSSLMQCFHGTLSNFSLQNLFFKIIISKVIRLPHLSLPFSPSKPSPLLFFKSMALFSLTIVTYLCNRNVYTYVLNIELQPDQSIHCYMFIYVFSADHMVSDNQLFRSSLGKTIFLLPAFLGCL